jgi:alginate O-acetyltransferase complex protein AlgI
MLFNSLPFILLFLPIVVVLHFTLARLSVDAAVYGTTVASLVFYAWWNPSFVVLPMLSILVNFWLARRVSEMEQGQARWLYIAGIAGNVLVLGYFKYADFLVSIFTGEKALPPNVPLALSFTTFVQIAFLSDAYRRRVKLRFSRYALFVAFFPHLIAGPIVRWTTFGRQLDDPERYRVNWDNIALGLTVFVFGLVKKVLIADPISSFVTAAFNSAAAGEAFTAFGAWAAAAGFVAQIYFDFSGYSDMAVGLGLLFNYRLPLNFAAPLRSTNLADFWRRWHITLSRFLRDFVYVPLGFGRPGPVRRSLNLLVTMLIGGIWHGAGWTFVVWGAIHGVLLLLTLIWQKLIGPARPNKVRQFFGWLFTFGAFVFAAVFFRATDIGAAWHLVEAMAGAGDHVAAMGHAPFDDWMIHHGYLSDTFANEWIGATWSMAGTMAVVAALAVALLVPDTMEIVGYKEGEAQSDWRRPVGFLAWRPTMAWLRPVAAMAVAVLINLGQVSEFLYYQF